MFSSNMYVHNICVGEDSAVSVETCYGLDGLGIDSWWGRDFLQPSTPALGPTQPPIQWILGLLRRDKEARVWY